MAQLAMLSDGGIVSWRIIAEREEEEKKGYRNSAALVFKLNAYFLKLFHSLDLPKLTGTQARSLNQSKTHLQPSANRNDATDSNTADFTQVFRIETRAFETLEITDRHVNERTVSDR